MKFSVSAATLALVAMVASTAVASESLYDRDVLPNGIRLPARTNHAISEIQRRNLVDRYLEEHPEERKRELAIEQLSKRSPHKRCKSKKHKSKAKSSSKSTKSDKKPGSGQKPAKTTATKSAETKAKSDKDTKSKSNDDDDNKNNDGGVGIADVVSGATGLISRFTFGGQCPNTGASDKYPNGNTNFLNCGIQSGWNPPKITMNQLSYISSDKAAKSSVFAPCQKYKSSFDAAAKATGVPAVMIMSIAMQESTCNANAVGGNGEQGIMQLTPEKCHSVNCHDAGQNIMAGAKYLKSQIDAAGGSVLLGLGPYNGWRKGMNIGDVYAMKKYGCRAQQNLDYLNQMLNGWMQGKDGNSAEFRKYNNLASC